MMNSITLMTVLAAILYCFEIGKVLKGIGFSLEAKISERGVKYFTAAALSVAAYVWALPLPLFYFFVYLILCIGIYQRKYDSHKNFYMINVLFVFYGALNLIVLGSIALLVNKDVSFVLSNPALRSGSIFVSMLVNGLVCGLIGRMVRMQKKLVMIYEKEEFKLLFSFMWFCAVFVFSDSIPPMFPLPASLVSLFLVGSNILLLLLVAFLSVHVYDIMQDAYLEEENFRLLLEKRKQESQTARMEKDVYVDNLTGAFTRAYAREHIENMIKSHCPFSMIYIDLDSLKHINDTKGHLFGDYHLEIFTQNLREHLRDKDILTRIGGDEFLVLLPGCEEEAADQRMHMIRKDMESDEAHAISYSFGTVYVPAEPDMEIEDYLKEADSRMYKDKESRR